MNFNMLIYEFKRAGYFFGPVKQRYHALVLTLFNQDNSVQKQAVLLFVCSETNCDCMGNISINVAYIKITFPLLHEADMLKSNRKAVFAAAIVKNHTRRVPSLRQNTPDTCPGGYPPEISATMNHQWLE